MSFLYGTVSSSRLCPLDIVLRRACDRLECHIPDMYFWPVVQVMDILRILSFRCFSQQITAILMIAGAPLFGETAETKQGPAADEKPSSLTTQPTKKHIYVGMPAEELQALIGKPQKIVSVPSKSDKEGHAEIWVYRRLSKSYTEVVTVGYKPVMGRRQNGNGSWADVVLSNEPETKFRVTEIYQVASFLIANGKYVATTQSEEKQQSFQ